MLHPGDLKSGIEKQLNALLQPIRDAFATPELTAITAAAYPEPEKVKFVKEKKVKEPKPAEAQ